MVRNVIRFCESQNSVETLIDVARLQNANNATLALYGDRFLQRIAAVRSAHAVVYSIALLIPMTPGSSSQVPGRSSAVRGFDNSSGRPAPPRQCQS